MKTENKKFYVTLEYVSGSNKSFEYKTTLGRGFASFDAAQQFGETVMDNTKDCNTRVDNFTVCWR